MIPVLIGVGVGLAAGALFAAISQSEKEREEFERAKEQYYSNIARLRKDIAEAKQGSFFFGYDFKLLSGLHYQSFKQGDIAYAGIQKARKSIKSYYANINEISKVQKERYSEMKSGTKTYSERTEIAKQLAELKNLKSNLYETVERLKVEKDEFSRKVKAFNAETHDLKIFIRDHCGRGGEVWYERLEERSSSYRDFD